MAVTRELQRHIPALDAMRKYPDPLYFRGNVERLQGIKLALVGSRNPSGYTRLMTQNLAAALSGAGVTIVSGGALGVDGIAHEAAGPSRTIAVLGNGLDLRYPVIHASMLEAIEREGLLLSPFADGFRATQWSFVVRNEIVVALGDALIVTQADRNSGSMRSVEYALKMHKKIYVLPHRLGESEGTNALIAGGKAEPIYDIDAFVSRFGEATRCSGDPFLEFCRTNPTYEEAVRAWPQEVFSYELEGKIAVRAGRVVVV